MSKQILPNELAEIVVGLLVKPQLLGELDTPDKHQAFMLDIGRVVAEHCGGEANWINQEDTDEDYLADQYNSPYLSVSPDDSLPSLNRNVWAYHDSEGWESETFESEGEIAKDQPLTPDAIRNVRIELQGLLSAFYETMLRETEISTPENYRVVVMSTAHLTESDNETLTTCASNGVQAVLHKQSGFIVTVYENDTYNERMFGSETLKNIILWAKNAGFSKIEFNCDANVLPQFPAFES